MPGCAVSGCKNWGYNKNNEGEKVKYHRFPRNKELAKQWEKACCRKNTFNLKYACICSLHFKEEDQKGTLRQELLGYHPKNARNLKEDAVPCLRLPARYMKVVQAANERKLRIEKRESKALVERLLAGAVKEENHSDGEMIVEEIICDVTSSAPQILNDPLEGDIKWLKADRERLRIENEELREELNCLPQKVTEEIQRILQPLFTPGQIQLLINPNQRIKWSNKDITEALYLRSVSPHAYTYLQNEKGFPLPSLASLRKWVTKLKPEEGVLFTVLNEVYTEDTSKRIN